MPDRPNILLLTSDQHRGDTLGCAGHPCIRTPHLDQLAYEGIRFVNAFVDAPVCIPARTTLVTGIQSHHYGSPSYNQNFRIDRARELFLGSLITAAGYQTQLVGKTHWHTDPTFRGGFEHVLGLDRMKEQRLIELGRRYGTHGLGANEIHGGRSQLPPHLHSTDWLVDRSIDFLAHRDETAPFFLWCSMVDPHPPLAIHEPYYSMYRDADIPEALTAEWSADPQRVPMAIECHRVAYNPKPLTPAEIRDARMVYYGMVTNLDHQIARLLGYLKKHGLYDNTIIIYSSDHGENLGDWGDAAKSNFLNTAANVPFIVRLPNSLRSEQTAPGMVSDALVQWADLLPTLCEATGAATPDDIDGVSLLDLCRGEIDSVRDNLHGQIDRSHLFHTGSHKYLYFTEDGRELVFDAAGDRQELRDLSQDIGLTSGLRQQFIDHLASEGHADLVDGQLRNDGRTAPDRSVLRARNPHGWLLTPDY